MVRVMRCANGKISGPKIVILDSHIEVYHNWLPPLLQPIAEDRKTVVCPMIDIIDKDDFHYIAQVRLYNVNFVNKKVLSLVMR